MTGATATGRRKLVLGAVMMFLGLPAVFALVEAVSFGARNRTNGTIVSSGQKREYLLYVPRSYDRAKPTPLVISMHGGALWPAAQMEISRWNTVADEQGLLVVYPSGAGGGGPTTSIRRASMSTDSRMVGACRLRCRADCPIGSRRSELWRLHSSCP